MPVLLIALYAISSLTPSKEIQAANAATLLPAPLLYVIVGFCSSLKFGAAVIVAFRAILSNVTVLEAVIVLYLAPLKVALSLKLQVILTLLLPSALCAIALLLTVAKVCVVPPLVLIAGLS